MKKYEVVIKEHLFGNSYIVEADNTEQAYLLAMDNVKTDIDKKYVTVKEVDSDHVYTYKPDYKVHISTSLIEGIGYHKDVLNFVADILDIEHDRMKEIVSVGSFVTDEEISKFAKLFNCSESFLKNIRDK